ncbi:MAG: alpha/beta hydrolase [Proteobacteria bacterium]|nr:alpha/beta hydrolase [Pseudomonadota bacterium]
MASEILQTIIAGMRAQNPLASLDVFEMRAGMQAMEGQFQPPDDVRYESVSAGGVPAEWTVAEDSDATRAVVYLHGGGYTIGGLGSHRPLCTQLALAGRIPVLNVDYRLAPENPFPAAVEDAVAAYRYVLGRGVSPASVAIGGDSAGGGLTLATLAALSQAGDPLPGAGVCISPWTDLTLTAETISSKAEEDPMVSGPLLEVMRDHYLGGADPASPTASPLFADPSGWPPLLIQVGTAEILLDDARRMAERASAAGVEVAYEPWEEMIHVWHTLAPMLPEATQAIERVAGFLSEKLD